MKGKPIRGVGNQSKSLKAGDYGSLFETPAQRREVGRAKVYSLEKGEIGETNKTETALKN